MDVTQLTQGINPTLGFYSDCKLVIVTLSAKRRHDGCRSLVATAHD